MVHVRKKHEKPNGSTKAVNIKFMCGNYIRTCAKRVEFSFLLSGTLDGEQEEHQQQQEYLKNQEKRNGSTKTRDFNVQ